MIKEATNGKLEKMEIQGFSKIDRKNPPDSTFTAMFNPDKYSKSYEIMTAPISRRSKHLKFVGQKQEYSFEFVLDGTGAASDKAEVKDLIEQFLNTVYNIKKEIHRPRYLKIKWGEKPLKCILKKATINYTMFKPTGEPLRATIKADFTENISDKLKKAIEKTSSPDLSHSRQVKAGDTLAGMVYGIYESLDPLVLVAQQNQLDSLRRVATGSELIFPPLKFSE